MLGLISAVLLFWTWRQDRVRTSERNTQVTTEKRMTTETADNIHDAEDPSPPKSPETLDGEAINSTEHIVSNLDEAIRSHGAVFDELTSFLDSIRKDVESKQISRPGYFAGMINNFASRGPESCYVDERIGFQETKYGQRASFRKVKKYTIEDVKAGIARNSAARWAVLEYFRTSIVRVSA